VINTKSRVLRAENDFFTLCKTTKTYSRVAWTHHAFTIVRVREKLDRRYEFFSSLMCIQEKRKSKKFFSKEQRTQKFFEWTVLLMQILKSCDNFFDAFAASSRRHGMLLMAYIYW